MSALYLMLVRLTTERDQLQNELKDYKTQKKDLVDKLESLELQMACLETLEALIEDITDHFEENKET